MKATVLVDNTPGCGLGGEWGLSIYIEYEDRRILLDTGASGLFLKNAEKLGLDIRAVDYAVLSHAHYDHADGMENFFRANDKACFYLRTGSGENCYTKVWIFHKYIGMPRHILERFKDRVVFAEGDYALCPGVKLVPHKTAGLAEIGKRNRMYVRDVSGWHPDDFAHEQSLVFETDSGLVIFNSCSHGGADNIIREVMETYPGQKVKAIVGGFHLFGRPSTDVRALARRIRDTGVEAVYTGHCTGEGAFQILREELGQTVHPLSVGTVIEVE